eukprot:1024304-Prymnesium_polylepis.1
MSPCRPPRTLLLRTLLLLLSLRSAAAAPAEVRLGALFSMFRTQAASYSIDSSGIRRFSSFVMALREINDKSDGIADELLPNTQLKFSFRDSKRDDSSSFFGALELTRDAFGGAGVSAIIGAASSGPSMAAGLVTARLRTPQISYSSTSALLSNYNAYPYFLRTPPSDAFQAQGMADVLTGLFQYSAVATAASTDGYGSAGIAAFVTAASDLGMSVLTSVIFAKDSTAFDNQFAELARVDARIIVLFCQASDAGLFLRGAHAAGVGGPGYLWFGSDAITIPDTWLNNDVLLDLTLRERVMLGYFGLSPSFGTGSKYQEYLTRVRAQPATTGNSTDCNMAKDDEGLNFIWAQDHDSDPATPL